MNRLLRGALRRGAVGFALGALLGVAILCLVRPGAFAGDAGWLIAYLVSSALYGAVGMGSTVVYDVERWSITRATLTHLTVTLGGLYIMGFAQGWLALSTGGFLVPTLAFIAAYFVIWLVQCLSMRRKISQMNRGVRAWKARQLRKTPSDAL